MGCIKKLRQYFPGHNSWTVGKERPIWLDPSESVLHPAAFWGSATFFLALAAFDERSKNLNPDPRFPESGDPEGIH